MKMTNYSNCETETESKFSTSAGIFQEGEIKIEENCHISVIFSCTVKGRKKGEQFSSADKVVLMKSLASYTVF